jgi:hypothetical protein
MAEPTDGLYELFEELAERLDVNLVQGKGDFTGGLCSVNDETYIVLNKVRPLGQRLRILAREFAGMDLSDVYLVPKLRTYIEEVGMALRQGKVV